MGCLVIGMFTVVTGKFSDGTFRDGMLSDGIFSEGTFSDGSFCMWFLHTTAFWSYKIKDST